MNKNYVVKTAVESDIETYYNKLISANPSNNHLQLQKEKRILRFRQNTAMFFYGVLGDEIICRASAVISANDLYIQNKSHILKQNTAYLFDFFTEEPYRNRGYFSKLFFFTENTLKDMGFCNLVLGVEPDDTENVERYKNYGFNTLIYSGTEEFDGMKLNVDYYVKSI